MRVFMGPKRATEPVAGAPRAGQEQLPDAGPRTSRLASFLCRLHHALGNEPNRTPEER
jgi:hypothetical protein